MTSPAGVGTSPSLLAQALPSDLSPLDIRSPYSWEEMDSYDPNNDLLNMFVTNLGPGVGTTRRSPAARNTPPAGAGSPAATSTPRATVAGVGTFTTRNVPGRASTPPGQEYLSAAARGKRPVVAHKTPRTRPTTGGKQPRRVPRQNTPSTPSDPGSRRRSSASGNSSRRSSGRGSGGGGGGGRGGGGGGGGGGGSGGGDDDDDDDYDSTPSSVAGPSRRRRRRRRADRLLNDAEMEQQLAQILQDQRQRAAGRRIAGITTTNTITTTYKNGQRPTVTRNSTSVQN